MILIIGGAYQGKLDYVKENYGIGDDIYTCSETTAFPDFSKSALNCFHLLVLAQIRNNIDHPDFLREHMLLLKDKIIISDDIFCGVVPIEHEMRIWRETLGRSLAYLSKNADEVYRVFCGLGTKLK